MSIEEQNKATERRIVEALNQGNLGIIDELFTPNYVYHLGAMEVRGRAAFKQFMQTALAAFPDFEMIVEDMIADGDKVVTRWVNRATHKGEFMGIPPTGKKVDFPGLLMARFKDGREVEAWDMADSLTMLQQLGVIPPLTQAGT